MAANISSEKIDLLIYGPIRPILENGFPDQFVVHRAESGEQLNGLAPDVKQKLRGMAVTYHTMHTGKAEMSQFPRLEMVASFGVGYDHIDAAWAGSRGIIVTNTPDVLTEEVADATLGLLLCTVRELSQAERYLRAGKWPEKPYPLTGATLRDRTIGLVGMGRIGKAVARRLEAFGVPVVYHTRRARPDVGYRHYPDLIAMARDVDTLVVIVPGGAETRHLINAEVLRALGPKGILVNVARGSVVDEPALIKALQERTIYAAGLDVYAHEPAVPEELLAMEHVVLLPHVGSASLHTRTKMDQLVVDNIVSWFAGHGPLTPVPETPWPPIRE